MTPPGTLLPLLREADWNGAGLAVGRRLLPEVSDRFLPWVTFAYDTGAQLLTVTEEGLREEGRTSASLEAEALANLSARALAWTESPTAEGARVLTFVDEYAAARILDPRALADARARLGADRLVAALPSRGILAVRAYAGPDALRALGAWAAEVFRDAPDTRVTPALVVLEGDRPVALLPPLRSAAAAASTLASVIYREEDGVAEVDCRPPTDAPLPAADLRQLRRIASSGRLAPGQPVDELRVVFIDRAAAERHGPELAAIDLVVCYRDEGGEAREL